MQRVFSRPKADLFAVLQGFLPFDVRVAVQDVVVMVVPFRVSQMIPQLAVANRLRLLAQIHAGLIQRNGIKGCQHSDIWKDWSIVLAMAVTVR